jgi:hypothetical protein
MSVDWLNAFERRVEAGRQCSGQEELKPAQLFRGEGADPVASAVVRAGVL